MTSIGIIGFGSFGKFLAEKLSEEFDIRVYGHGKIPESWSAPLEHVARCDYVILAIGVHSYDEVISALKPHLRPDNVIVDVCSIKLLSSRSIRAQLPQHKVVATHPMFGPESANESVVGHTIVMCPELSDDVAYTNIKSFVKYQGIEVIEMSADEHDRQIATVQGLTFFVARTLGGMHLGSIQLSTPSFRRLLHLEELERHHSDELFRTIQKGNPYVSEVRHGFLKHAKEIDDELGT